MKCEDCMDHDAVVVMDTALLCGTCSLIRLKKAVA